MREDIFRIWSNPALPGHPISYTQLFPGVIIIVTLRTSMFSHYYLYQGPRSEIQALVELANRSIYKISLFFFLLKALFALICFYSSIKSILDTLFIDYYSLIFDSMCIVLCIITIRLLGNGYLIAMKRYSPYLEFFLTRHNHTNYSLEVTPYCYSIVLRNQPVSYHIFYSGKIKPSGTILV